MFYIFAHPGLLGCGKDGSGCQVVGRKKTARVDRAVQTEDKPIVSKEKHVSRQSDL
jgi:hypothetical protein